MYQTFSLAYIGKVINALIREHDGRRVPVIVFTKGGGQWLEAITDTGCDAVGLDWTANLAQARQRMQDRVALQGNLDPMVMFGGDAAIREQARKVLDDFGPVGNGGHVFNFGHGISRYTSPDAVAALVDEVHTYSRAKHQGGA
jgi:uroporphyrinogen decarboxylase